MNVYVIFNRKAIFSVEKFNLSTKRKENNMIEWASLRVKNWRSGDKEKISQILVKLESSIFFFGFDLKKTHNLTHVWGIDQ